MKVPSTTGTHGGVKNVAVIQSFDVMVSTGSWRKHCKMLSSFGQFTAVKNRSARLWNKDSAHNYAAGANEFGLLVTQYAFNYGWLIFSPTILMWHLLRLFLIDLLKKWGRFNYIQTKYFSRGSYFIGHITPVRVRPSTGENSSPKQTSAALRYHMISEREHWTLNCYFKMQV